MPSLKQLWQDAINDGAVGVRPLVETAFVRPAEPCPSVTTLLAVAGQLARKANASGRNAWPALRTVAGLCGISESTVRRSVRWLAAAGYLSPVGRPGRTTEYVLTLPSPSMMQEPLSPLEPLPRMEGAPSTMLGPEPRQEPRPSGAGEGTRGNHDARAEARANAFPRQCAEHQSGVWHRPCRRCGEARQSFEAQASLRHELERLAERERQAHQREQVLANIRECPLCDDDGRLPPRVYEGRSAAVRPLCNHGYASGEVAS